MSAPPPTPANPPSIEEQASALYKAGDINAAIALFEVRVKEHPEDVAAWRKLARLLVETWQFARADAVITHTFTMFGPDPATLALQVFAKQELGLFHEARAIAETAARQFPDQHLNIWSL